jgi:hypothetical protein
MMEIRTRLILIAIACFTPYEALFAQQPEAVIVKIFGRGSVSCAEYLERMDEQNYTSNWILGYITGLSIVSKEVRDNVYFLNNDALLSATRVYCSQHLTDMVVNAVMKISYPGQNDKGVTVGK